MEFLKNSLPFFSTLFPLLLRFIINFQKEETYLSNSRKQLLNQIRIGLSSEIANCIIFDDEIVEIDDDFHTKLQDGLNDFIYSKTHTFFEFNQAIIRSKKAINWIRIFKYSLVLSTFILTLIFMLLFIFNKELFDSSWYWFIIGFSFIILMIWIFKEKFVDNFNNLCIKYEIERTG